MTKQFTASVWLEGQWFVAHCNEIEIASQGKTEEEAIANLREAIELHFEQPTATIFPTVHSFEVELYA
jgi:predicted RNase H-like HicB family nuclease